MDYWPGFYKPEWSGAELLAVSMCVADRGPCICLWFSTAVHVRCVCTWKGLWVGSVTAGHPSAVNAKEKLAGLEASGGLQEGCPLLLCFPLLHTHAHFDIAATGCQTCNGPLLLLVCFGKLFFSCKHHAKWIFNSALQRKNVSLIIKCHDY